MASIRAWLMAKSRNRAPSPAEAADLAPSQGEPEPGSLNLTANVPDERMYTWDSQAAQYPPKGPPGISYFRGQLSEELFVECILCRDETGQLVGILNHYPADIPPFQRAGDKNIWVHPGHRRQGIGTTLLLEAWFRFGPRQNRDGPNPDGPRLTESGVQFLTGLEERYRGSKYDFRDIGWEAWQERRAQELENPEDDWRAVGWEAWHKRQAKEHEDAEVPEIPDHDPNK
jgi:GNAT superfamily N-acetyltransferase